MLAALFAAGCTQSLDESQDTTAATSEELLAVITPAAAAYSYATSTALPHGVAGDQYLVFNAEPLAARVVVRDRFLGHQVAELPQPPDGALILPFDLARDGNTLIVLDPGGFPNPSGPPTTARIIEYTYAWDRHARRFTASHLRTVSLAGLPVVFTEDLERLSDGSTIVAESIIGALWYVSPTGAVAPAIFPASPSSPIAALAPCAFPDGVTVDGIPFESFGDFAPGVGALTADDSYLYFSGSCSGGLYRVPLAALTDGRLPWERASDIELVSARPADAQVDSLKGLSIDVYGDPDFLYALDCFGTRLVRIDLTDGTRDLVVNDGRLLDFPVSMTFLPPVLGSAPLVVVSDQEHRWTALNAALTADQFRSPFILTKVFPFRAAH